MVFLQDFYLCIPFLFVNFAIQFKAQMHFAAKARVTAQYSMPSPLVA